MENNADRETLRKIKDIILKTAEKFNIKIERIILFGSRAKGKAKKYSDWDIIIITEKKLDKNILDDFWLEVDRELVEIGIIPEIIVVEKDVVEKYRSHKGYVYYYALKEGISV